jgi:glycosyltransferase involved in cell wall biosynthesis
MDAQPLVSVVCLCHNQQDFVIEAIQSVMHQTYKPIEIIVVDDASTDNSANIIRSFCASHQSVKFVELTTNIGNRKAFNQAFALTKGEFIIDLAADDILLPTRVEEGVRALMNNGTSHGVHFSDAECVDKSLNRLWIHSGKISMKNIPTGDVYKELISRYFVCAPTVMCRRSVLEALGGYDESLAFEDFDFWIRSSRLFKYCYSDQVLVKKRILPRSMSSSQYRFGSLQMRSIFVVCKKIFALNRDRNEMQALKKRVHYELRHAIRTLNARLVFDYWILLRQINKQISRGAFPSAYPSAIA